MDEGGRQLLPGFGLLLRESWGVVPAELDRFLPGCAVGGGAKGTGDFAREGGGWWSDSDGGREGRPRRRLAAARPRRRRARQTAEIEHGHFRSSLLQKNSIPLPCLFRI